MDQDQLRAAAEADAAEAAADVAEEQAAANRAYGDNAAQQQANDQRDQRALREAQRVLCAAEREAAAQHLRDQQAAADAAAQRVADDADIAIEEQRLADIPIAADNVAEAAVEAQRNRPQQVADDNAADVWEWIILEMSVRLSRSRDRTAMSITWRVLTGSTSKLIDYA